MRKYLEVFLDLFLDKHRLALAAIIVAIIDVLFGWDGFLSYFASVFIVHTLVGLLHTMTHTQAN